MTERKKRAPRKYRALTPPKDKTAPVSTDKAGGDETPPVREPGNPAGVGDNNPPPEAAWATHIDGLFVEAQSWLDGEPIATDAQAADVAKLKGMLSEAAKGAEAARAEAKKPHLDAGRAVDAAFKPIIDKAEKALKVAQRALTPWLEAVQAEQRRIALEKQREAEAAAERLRQQAIAARASSDLEDEEVRETLEQEAEQAAKDARDALREKPVVRTDHGGASLRTFWLVSVTDPRELLQFYLRERPETRDALKEWLLDQARKDVRAGGRSLPGCNIWSEKRAV